MDSEKSEKLKKSTLDGMIWIFAERMSAKLVSFLVTLVLARLLMPEDYSIISVAMIFFSLLVNLNLIDSYFISFLNYFLDILKLVL